MTLILSWAIILSIIIIMYVILDGFDLGIGILFFCTRKVEQHDIMVNTIAPLWDGNETWLVMGAACLYAAFPTAYSALLPTLYMPIMIMLAALIFRGVTFEFRFKVGRHRYVWDSIFATASTLAAFMQGVILGTFVRGYGYDIPIVYYDYHWLTPFSLMTGIAVVIGYALLGSTWLIMKTVGELQNKMFRYAKFFLIAIGVFIALVSVWTPLMEPQIKQQWFTLPNFFYLLPLPIATAIAGFYCLYALHQRYEKLPFCLAIGLFIFSYIGFCISDWPYIVPHAITIWDAAAAPSTLKFMLVGITILMPVLLGYTAYAYWIFRGKITSAQHYH